MNESKITNAREIMKRSYARINEQKKKRKLIILTTPHIEHDILRRKRRIQTK